MAEVFYYMNYVIFFQDPDEYQFAVATAGGTNLLATPPRAAADLFGIPFPYPSGDLNQIPKGIYFIPPYTPGAQFFFPGPTGVFVDDTVNTSVGSALGAIGVFVWSGNIILNGGAVTEGEPAPEAIAQRRWVFGRELLTNYEAVNIALPSNITADSSRVFGGYGIKFSDSTANNTINNTVDQFRTGLVTPQSWERFYLRIRKFPLTEIPEVWRGSGTGGAGGNISIRLNSAGELRYFESSPGVDTGLITQIQLNTWYRIDILLRYRTGPPPPRGVFKVYINGNLVFTKNSATNAGIDVVANHTTSSIGAANTGIPEAEWDADDWINADLPGNVDPITLDFIDDNFSIDWLLGSHVKVHHNVASSQVSWLPAGAGTGVLNQKIPTNIVGVSELTSITSVAVIQGLTDALPLDIPDSIGIIVGATGAIVSLFSSNSGGTDGSLGYSVNGVPTLATIDQITTPSINKVAYLPSGMILPNEISPYLLIHGKSADVNLDTTRMLVSVVEYIGIWGPEDAPLFNIQIPRLNNSHNHLYANTAWGYLGSAPEAPVAAIGGTYVGNGTYQEIILPTPCHFLWIRPLTGGITNGGVKFFGGAYSPNAGPTINMFPECRVFYDFLTGEFKFSVTGAAGSDCNVNGITYQYIAFCDPGMRFNLCGSFGHGGTAQQINTLIVPNFLPEAGFVQAGITSAVGSGIGLYLKGPANAGDFVTPLNGVPLVTGYSFALGILNTLNIFHTPQAWNYSLWRTLDSAGLCTNVAVQILSYTGDGTASRDIDLTPISNKFPLFVLVSPGSANGISFFRDPSHTANNSSNVSLGNSTTAITAVGVDQITIGVSINVVGVIYNIFTFVGDVLGMNNGVFFQDYCDNNGPYVPPVEPTPTVFAEGGILLNGLTALTALRSVSGIYTLIKGQHHDTYIDRPTMGDAEEVNIKIPNPKWKTGYIGG